MGKITFKPSHYWDGKTMALGDAVTDEQWQQVQDVCDKLNIKYSQEQGCQNHTDTVHYIQVGLFADFVDIQVIKRDTCCCHNIVNRLIEIRNTETMLLNKDYFKGKQSAT